MQMGKLRVLKLAGSYYEMGYQHGKTYYDEIHMFTEDRLKLSSDPNWTGRSLSREEVLALGEACLEEHERYCPDLMQEIRGMADATGLGMAELIIMNGYTDFIDTVYAIGDRALPSVPQPVDDCTAFLVPAHTAQDGRALFGQTWDMHASATPYVILIHGTPVDAPSFYTFTITGCVGMIGMNDAGICVGINNLMANDGQIGVMWNFVVRKILQQRSLEDALDCLRTARLAGGHNYLLMDRSGQGYNVEAMPTYLHIERLDQQALIHTNHCLLPQNQRLERERLPESLASSHNRLRRAGELLAQPDITPEMLMEITRDPEAICVRAKPPMHVESCGAAIMRPASNEFWAVWGLPTENDYEHFVL